MIKELSNGYRIRLGIKADALFFDVLDIGEEYAIDWSGLEGFGQTEEEMEELLKRIRKDRDFEKKLIEAEKELEMYKGR